jgi:hypothetical protein
LMNSLPNGPGLTRTLMDRLSGFSCFDTHSLVDNGRFYNFVSQ